MHIVAQHYHIGLVIVSYIVASLAAYAAMDIGRRVVETKGRVQLIWTLSGGGVMGLGIWDMHFIGMLALNLPVQMSYRTDIVLLSILYAVLGPALGLFVIARPLRYRYKLSIGAVLMAAGIVCMHYTGMAAMVIPGKYAYNPFLYTVSCIIALFASFVALSMMFVFSRASGSRQHVLKVLCALVMGVAVAGMHYTGMAGTTFWIRNNAPDKTMSNGTLATAVAVSGILVLLFTLMVIVFDRRIQNNNSQLRVSDEQFRSLYANNHDAIFSVNLDGEYTDMNQRARELLGNLGTEFHIHNLLQMMESSDIESLRTQHQRALQGETGYCEVTIRPPNSEVKVLSIMNIPTVVDGEVVGLFLIARDITAERASAEQMNYLAFHDPLTQMPNRRMFEERIDEFLQHASPDSQLHILFLDLDRFKSVNDTLGHRFGDRLLQHVGELIRTTAHEATFSARMGGDEFIIALINGSKEAAVNIAHTLVTHLRKPLTIDDRTVYVTASMGIASYPDDGTSRDMLLQRADIAMYSAKAAGRSNFQVYKSSVGENALKRLETETELREAVETGRFRLAYQPKVDIQSGQTIGFEALIRWPRKSGITGSPADFIPIAEETGLIVPIGEWCLREAARQAKSWYEEGNPSTIAVNLSPQQVMSGRLIKVIQDALQETGLPAQLLELEITESTMFDENMAREFLEACQSMGIRVSLDDFGTGYSSLSRLISLPMNLVKIDRSFIQHIETDERSKALVASVIDITHTLGMRCLAEGVETVEQLSIIKELGCDEAQGFWFAKPLPADEAGTWIVREQTISTV